MIAAIGLMVGTYILTRMAEALLSKDVHPVARVLSILTILVTLLALADIVMSAASSSRSDLPPGLR